MPIKPENRKRYPKDWKEISNRIRFERAEGRCECTGECGAHHGKRCEALHGEAHPNTGSIVVLTTAHLEQPVENCADDNLKAMCQRCHLCLDMAIHKQNRLDGMRCKETIDLLDTPIEPKGVR